MVELLLLYGRGPPTVHGEAPARHQGRAARRAQGRRRRRPGPPRLRPPPGRSRLHHRREVAPGKPSEQIPYDIWRDFDPADSVRFYALRLREAGIIDRTPEQILQRATEFSYLAELKHELKGAWPIRAREGSEQAGQGALVRFVARAAVPIRRKLVVAFGAVVALLVTIGAIGLYALGQANNRAEGLSRASRQGIDLPPAAERHQHQALRRGLRAVRSGPDRPRRRPASAQPVLRLQPAAVRGPGRGRVAHPDRDHVRPLRHRDDAGDHVGAPRKADAGPRASARTRQASRGRARTAHEPTGEQGRGGHRQPGRRQPAGLPGLPAGLHRDLPRRHRSRPAPGLRHLLVDHRAYQEDGPALRRAGRG